jgi:cyclopropane fatty-acyl-phospholipid synthase-like methyltransferase
MTHWTERLFQKQAAAYTEFFESRFDDAVKEVDELLQLVEDERGVTPEHTLDVPCGSGRHVLAFADEGHHVEGLDFSEEFVDQARDRASERGLTDRAEFHVHDMRDLDEWEGTYDLVTNFWNSMGYYDKETDVEMLSEMNRLLANDGVVAIQTSNKEYYVKNFEPSSVSEDDDRLYVERQEFEPETGRFHTALEIFSAGDTGYEHQETMEWEPRFYAPVEWTEMCETAGFDDVSLFGELDGEPLSLDSDTIVILAS